MTATCSCARAAALEQRAHEIDAALPVGQACQRVVVREPLDVLGCVGVAQDVFQSVWQQSPVDGLRHEVRGAGLESAADTIRVVVPGHHHDRRAAETGSARRRRQTSLPSIRGMSTSSNTIATSFSAPHRARRRRRANERLSSPAAVTDSPSSRRPRSSSSATMATRFFGVSWLTRWLADVVPAARRAAARAPRTAPHASSRARSRSPAKACRSSSFTPCANASAPTLAAADASL